MLFRVLNAEDLQCKYRTTITREMFAYGNQSAIKIVYYMYRLYQAISLDGTTQINVLICE